MAFFGMSDREKDVLKDEESARIRNVTVKVESYEERENMRVLREADQKRRDLNEALDKERDLLKAATFQREKAQLLASAEDAAKEAERLAKHAKAEAEAQTKIAVIETKLSAAQVMLDERKDKVALIDSIPELENRAATAEAEAKGKDIAIAHLKEDITRLDDLVKFMAGLIPKLELDKIAFNMNADVKIEQKGGGNKDQKKEGGGQS